MTTLLVLVSLAAEASEGESFSVGVLVGEVGDLGGKGEALSRRGEGTGNPIVGFNDSVALEVRGTFRGRVGDDPRDVPGLDLWARLAYHTFAVDFGVPFLDVFESPWESVQFGTGRHHMIKIGIGLTYSRDAPFRFDYGGGLVVGVCRYSSLRVSSTGATRVGVESVSAEGGLSFGIEGEAILPIGRTGLLLGVSSSLMGMNGSGAEVTIEMAEDAPFHSGATGISPITVGAFLEYEFGE